MKVIHLHLQDKEVEKTLICRLEDNDVNYVIYEGFRESGNNSSLKDVTLPIYEGWESVGDFQAKILYTLRKSPIKVIDLLPV